MIPKDWQAFRTGLCAMQIAHFGAGSHSTGSEPVLFNVRRKRCDPPECNPALQVQRLQQGRFGSTCAIVAFVQLPAIMQPAGRMDVGRMGERVSRRRSGEESVMVRQVGHSDGFDAIVRANRTFLLGLLWGGLFACVVVASVYDIGRWINLW
jgi:hypothetical protein